MDTASTRGTGGRRARRYAVVAVAGVVMVWALVMVCVIAPPRAGSPPCYWASYEGVCLSERGGETRTIVLRDSRGMAVRSPRVAVGEGVLVYWAPETSALRVVRAQGGPSWLHVDGVGAPRTVAELVLERDGVTIRGGRGAEDGAPWVRRVTLDRDAAGDDSGGLPPPLARPVRGGAWWPLRLTEAVTVEPKTGNRWTAAQLPFAAGWELWLTPAGRGWGRCRSWSSYPVRPPFGSLTPELRHLLSLAGEAPPPSSTNARQDPEFGR